MNQSVYVYGIGGTLYPEEMLKHFGLERIIENYPNSDPFSFIFTRPVGDLVLGKDIKFCPPGFRAVFHDNWRQA